MTTLVVDPRSWIVSFARALNCYAVKNFDPDIYEVVMEWPSSSVLGKIMPLEKTLIHFEIDNVTNPVIGFGQMLEITADEQTGVTTQIEGRQHNIDIDVGIWASARSGGTTARLAAYQILTDIFVGPSAYFALKEIGIELMSFTGFSCVREEIDDIEVFRAMNMTLLLRVFSEKALEDGIDIQTIQQDGALTIDDQLLIDVPPMEKPLEAGVIGAPSHFG